jgi:hypothetical protein
VSALLLQSGSTRRINSVFADQKLFLQLCQSRCTPILSHQRCETTCSCHRLGENANHHSVVAVYQWHAPVEILNSRASRFRICDVVTCAAAQLFCCSLSRVECTCELSILLVARVERLTHPTRASILHVWLQAVECEISMVLLLLLFFFIQHEHLYYK